MSWYRITSPCRCVFGIAGCTFISCCAFSCVDLGDVGMADADLGDDDDLGGPADPDSQ